MTYKHQINKGVTGPTGQINEGLRTYTGTAIHEIKQEDVPDASTDLLMNIAFKVADVKSIFLLATVAMTLETNDGTTPGNTLALKANIAYEWNVDAYDSLALTVDVTAFYLTNASGSAGKFSAYVLVDPTP